MTITLAGVAIAAWTVLRFFSTMVLALVLLRWHTLTEAVTGSDATPQMAFVFFGVLPLGVLTIVGVFTDVRAMRRQQKLTGRRAWVRALSAALGTLLILVTAMLFVHSPP